MSVWNDVQVLRFVSPVFPVVVFALQWVMEEAVSDTVPDGQHAPFELVCLILTTKGELNC